MPVCVASVSAKCMQVYEGLDDRDGGQVLQTRFPTGVVQPRRDGSANASNRFKHRPGV